MALLPATYKGSATARVLVIMVGVFALVVLGFHMWFINNARGILIDIVDEKSSGQVKLALSKARFNFFSNQLQIQEGELITTDTVTAETSYRVKFSSLALKVRSFWPLLLKKDLYLDSININDPLIEVVQWRKDNLTNSSDNDLSITQEMGTIYNSMLNVLQDFGIRRILVNNASIKLSNKAKPGSFPVWITNINLNVLRDPDNPGNKAGESLQLQAADQSIVFPSGRHRLSFKRFNLQLLKNRIELDSCTISAVARGKSTSSYRIFFKKLMLVGVDFAAMSDQNLVRADSVYCVNPMFNVTLNPGEEETPDREKRDPERIVKELTSDLDLAFVGVKDAGIQLNIMGDRPRRINNGNKDNFEIRGLNINGDSSVPVSVDRFDMVVRDYHLYNADSSAIFGFDSIHFSNRKIILNNFTVLTTPSRYKVKSLRDFKFPRFELSDLDWYALIFDQNVVAREAVLTNPTINYTRRTPASNKKQNLFETLQNLDSLMTLDQLSINDGVLNLNFGQATQLQLRRVNLKVSSNRLMRATNRESLRKAVDYFSLNQGILRRKDLTAQLINIRYDPNNVIYADKLLVSSTTKRVTAEVNKVLIKNMLLDESTDIIEADAITWNTANVTLLTANTAGKKKGISLGGSLNIRNIQGQKTLLSLDNGITTINGAVNNLSLGLLEKTDNGPLHIEQLLFKQNQFVLKNEVHEINAGNNDLEVDKMILMNEASDVIADGVRWSSADVRIALHDTSTRSHQNVGSLSINNLSAHNTSINLLKNNKGELKSTITLLQAEELVKQGSAPFRSEGFLLDGNNLQFSTENILAGTSTFRVAQNSPSFVRQFTFSNHTGTDTTVATVPETTFTIDINDLLAGKYHLTRLEVEAPSLAHHSSQVNIATDTVSKNTADIKVDELLLRQPTFSFSDGSGQQSLSIQLPHDTAGRIVARNISLNSSGLLMDSIFVSNNSVHYSGARGTAFTVNNAHMRAALSNVFIKKKANGWGAMVDEVSVEDPIVRLKGKTLPVKVGAVSLGGVNISNQPVAAGDYFTASKNAWLRTTTALFTDSNTTLQWQGALYSNIDKTLVIDSFQFAPKLSRDAYMAQLPYEADYTTLSTKTISLKGLDLNRYENDSALIVESVSLKEPQLYLYRDKRLPDAKPTQKFFLGEMISKVAKEVSIPIISITNGEVSYTEKNDKTGAEGTLLLTQLNGTVSNVKNRRLKKSDSLHIAVDALLMDTAPLSLNLAESYLDSASGFDMQVAIQPFTMNMLNPVMTPLTGVKIVSGNVDALRVHAVANENYAVGKIKMNYNDLRIRMSNGSKKGRGTLRQRVVNFIANSFIINNNNDKTGVIFHVRKSDKSFFSYLLKIAMDGIASSVGAADSYKKIRLIEKAAEGGLLPDYSPVFNKWPKQQ